MKPKFYAVIHAEDEVQVMRNITRAQEAEADGVFLINHSISAEKLIALATIADREFPHLWLGVNRLGYKWSRIFSDLPPCVKAVWSDNGLIDCEAEEQKDAETVATRRKRWGGLHFGGVAFKTQQPLTDYGAAKHAIKAKPYVQVITTSGPGTGQPPTVSKIQRMRMAIGNHPLAIASGITPENVAGFLPCVDHLLVATGVSDSFTELSLSRMKALVKTIRES